MDAKEISEKAAKAKAASNGWAADAVSRLVAAGQSIMAKKEQVRTASAPERRSPFSNNQIESVSRLDRGTQASGPRDLKSITAQDKDRQIGNAVQRARQLVEKKIGSMPINGPSILYMKAEISRWDDHSGQPQTGRISFQIPFHGPQGDPRTIYSSVDLVMGDLMEPKTFTDGLNNVYAFDKTGLTELFKGENFDVVHQPKVAPQTKYTGPEFHSPDGQGGAVAAVNSPLIFKKSLASHLTKTASGEKPMIAREGLIRPLSKEAFEMPQPISPAEVRNLGKDKTPSPRKPANAGTAFTIGTSAEDNRTDPHGNATQGGQTDPTLASAELREISHDGVIVSTAKGDVKSLIEKAHAMTYGGHDYIVEVWDGGKMVERVASAGKSIYQVASGMSKVIADLRLLDIRMLSFHDLIMLCKQHGKDGDISFDAASKDLAKAGIVLFKTASKADGNLARRVVLANAYRFAAPPPDSTEAPAPVEMTNNPSPAPGAEQGSEGAAEIAPPEGLDTVSFKEFEALKYEWQQEKATIDQRENNNVANGNPPHMGIDYTNLQLLTDKMNAFINKAKAGASQDLASAPADLAAKDKTAPAAASPAPAPSAPAETGGTITPEKGKGLASRVPGLERKASFQGTLCAAEVKTATYDAKTPEKCTKCDWQSPYGDDSRIGHPCPKCQAPTGRFNPATGEIWKDSPTEKTATFDVDDDAKAQMMNMGLDPADPEKVKEFMGTFKKVSSHSQKFPMVCKNCKDLVVPNGYSALNEYKHTRLPFCGAAKKPGVGFVHAYFRDCVGYDPIVKDLAQKIESKAPESEQTEADQSKGMKEKKAAALPSASTESVADKDGQTGAGLDIRKWCIDNGHYAKAGEVHPAHDWCTLWNTAVENLVKMPGGAVIPRSMSGQTSETHGEGGPHQFGNTHNQTI